MSAGTEVRQQLSDWNEDCVRLAGPEQVGAVVERLPVGVAEWEDACGPGLEYPGQVCEQVDVREGRVRGGVIPRCLGGVHAPLPGVREPATGRNPRRITVSKREGPQVRRCGTGLAVHHAPAASPRTTTGPPPPLASDSGG